MDCGIRFQEAWAADEDDLQPPFELLVFRAHPAILRVHCRPVLVGDGLKLPKAGRQMPAV